MGSRDEHSTLIITAADLINAPTQTESCGHQLTPVPTVWIPCTISGYAPRQLLAHVSG